MTLAAPKPSRIRVRCYQVGFGDCFLLSFFYGHTTPRHVLIDFGSVAMPKHSARGSLVEISKNILETCRGSLDAVVATHRHVDHIGGFGGESGKVIASMSPKVIVQPWTEDPGAAPSTARVARRNSDHVLVLSHMRKLVQSVIREIMLHRKTLPSLLLRELSLLCAINTIDDDALATLMTMGQKHVFAHCFSKSGLEAVLPGVRVHVLGPPTIEQVSGSHDAESSVFWVFEAEARRVAAGGALFADAKTLRDRSLPSNTRPFPRQVDRIYEEQLLEVIRRLDEVVNNTSLILLFEVGRRKLLFPGDAQYKAWEYCLNVSTQSQRVRRLLRKVDFYKVGHHGSSSATPKMLWNLFDKRGGPRGQRMTTMLSTLPRRLAGPSSHNEIPREPLVDALRQNTNFSTTQDLRRDLFRDFELRVS